MTQGRMQLSDLLEMAGFAKMRRSVCFFDQGMFAGGWNWSGGIFLPRWPLV
jgi:hypothetical protein